MDQNKTPLFDALVKYKKNQIYSFHVPGHKDGLTFNDSGKEIFDSILSIDATEVYGLDDLYEPVEAIAEAQSLLTDLYRTVKSYFLVNGSTVGNLVMVLATCKAGDKVLVQRNSHKSIFNALKLARVEPIFLAPEIEGTSSIPIGLSKELVHQAIIKYPDVKALILTYPNYYGMAKRDYQEIIYFAKKKGLLVLVDEAHGAHFILGSPVPRSTLRMGADIVVHSAHKTLPAMTMGSYLHVNSRSVSIQKIEDTLEVLQTSSPSYPIMASLDLARAYLAGVDESVFQRILDTVGAFKQLLHQMGLGLLNEGSVNQDPFKITLCSDGCGFQFQEVMQRMGLFPEMADPDHVLITLAVDEHFPFNKVIRAFEEVLGQFKPTVGNNNKGSTSKSPLVMSPLTVNYEEQSKLTVEKTPLKMAVGRIAAQMVIPYPPGVPVLIAGELVTEERISEIAAWQKVGARFHGLNKESVIAVYKEL